MKKEYRWTLRDEVRLAYGCDNNQAMICTTEKFYKLFRDAAAQGVVDIELQRKIFELLQVISESMLYEGDPVKMTQMVGIMRKILKRTDGRLVLPPREVVSVNSQETKLKNVITSLELQEFREILFISAEAYRLLKEGKSKSVVVVGNRKFRVTITEKKLRESPVRNAEGIPYGGVQAWDWCYYRDEATV